MTTTTTTTTTTLPTTIEESKKYEYETISSFVEKLKTLSPTDYINVAVNLCNILYIHCNDDGLIQRSFIYGIDNWNSLYLLPGKTLISDALKTLEPLIEKKGSCLIELYVNTNRSYQLINSNTLDVIKTYAIVPLQNNDINVRKTHIFTEEHHVKWQKDDFLKNLEHFTKLTKNNKRMLHDYLETCCIDYPKLDIYVIDTEVFTDFESIKECIDNINEDAKKYFVNKENLWICSNNIKELEHIINRDEEAKDKEEQELESKLKQEAKQKEPRIFYRVGFMPYTEPQICEKYPKMPFEMIVKMFTIKVEYLNFNGEKEIVLSCPDYVMFEKLVEILSS